MEKYSNKLNELKEKVNSLSSIHDTSEIIPETKLYNDEINIITPSINLPTSNTLFQNIKNFIRSNGVYVSIPIIVCIILLYFKPSVIMMEVKIGHATMLVLNYTNLFLWTVIISSVLILTSYLYAYKK